jgi:hypothetical protein
LPLRQPPLDRGDDAGHTLPPILFLGIVGAKRVGGAESVSVVLLQIVEKRAGVDARPFDAPAPGVAPPILRLYRRIEFEKPVRRRSERTDDIRVVKALPRVSGTGKESKQTTESRKGSTPLHCVIGRVSSPGVAPKESWTWRLSANDEVLRRLDADEAHESGLVRRQTADLEIAI